MARGRQRPAKEPQNPSNSSGTGNVDNRSINVSKRKNNSRERKNPDVNEKKNAREMKNAAKTRGANKRNNSAPGSGMKPRRKQKDNPILVLGSRSIRSP